MRDAQRTRAEGGGRNGEGRWAEPELQAHNGYCPRQKPRRALREFAEDRPMKGLRLQFRDGEWRVYADEKTTRLIRGQKAEGLARAAEELLGMALIAAGILGALLVFFEL